MKVLNYQLIDSVPLANTYLYNFLSVEQIKSIYYDLIINDKKDEIIFKSKDKAIMLTKVMFQCSRVYTSDENRYCMEYLANLLKTALTKKLITQDDFPILMKVLSLKTSAKTKN